MPSAPTATVRPVRRDDVPALVAMVHELAAYEREPDACLLTGHDLDAALFAEHPAVFGHVAEVPDADGSGASGPVGMALWYVTYSTWTGVHGIHLEDLYVAPAHRRGGLARTLLAALAGVCVERGYARLEWSVLDWNTPALDFYATLGSAPMTGWTTHRLDGPALAALVG